MDSRSVKSEAQSINGYAEQRINVKWRPAKSDTRIQPLPVTEERACECILIWMSVSVSHGAPVWAASSLCPRNEVNDDLGEYSSDSGRRMYSGTVTQHIASFMQIGNFSSISPLLASKLTHFGPKNLNVNRP